MAQASADAKNPFGRDAENARSFVIKMTFAAIST